MLRSPAPWLAAVLLAAGLLAFFHVADPDVFWHLRTGQVILETGRLVRTNLFSATYPDYPWKNLEWLHEVVLALAFNAFGWAGVAALKTALVLATTAVVFLTLLGRAARPPLAAAVTAVVLAAIRYRLTERPQIFSLLFLAVTIWAVERSRARGGRAIWVLPPLYAVWGNIHPEVTLGLGFLAAGLLGDAIDSRRGRALPAGTLRRHAAVLACAAVATLANPHTTRVVLVPILLQQESFVGSIKEFRRATVATVPLFWTLLAAAVLVLLLRRESRRWSTILPLALFAVPGILYLRGGTCFALAAAPVLHEPLAAAAPTGGPARRRLVAAAAGTAACGALFWTARHDRLLSYRWGYGPDDRLVPDAAASFILANPLPPNLYNHYGDGGYLIYRLYPKMGVFQDGRGPYPREFYEALAAHRGEAFPRLLERHGVNTALVHSAEYGPLFPPEVWAVVYWDDAFAVLVRRSAATAEVLRRLEYRACLPGRMQAADERGWSLALSEMRRNQAERLRPSWRLAIGMGVALLRLRDLAGAELEMLRATEIAPREPEAWAYLSVVRSMQGKSAEAAAAAAAARRLDPALTRVQEILGAPPR